MQSFYKNLAIRMIKTVSILKRKQNAAPAHKGTGKVKQ
jgi:hypothetical protein